jgi:hypothetical protein
MGQITTTAAIAATPEAVWDVISAPHTYEQWMTIHTKWKGDVPERFSEGATAAEVVTISLESRGRRRNDRRFFSIRRGMKPMPPATISVVSVSRTTGFPENGSMRVRFYENAKGIAPGQSAVFYEGEDVIGGGIIQRGQLI